MVEQRNEPGWFIARTRQRRKHKKPRGEQKKDQGLKKGIQEIGSRALIDNKHRREKRVRVFDLKRRATTGGRGGVNVGTGYRCHERRALLKGALAKGKWPKGK